MDARIERVNPPQLHRPPGYHQVTVVGTGPMAYLAGQCPIDIHGDLVGPGDIDAQVDQVVANAVAALAAVGGDISAVLAFWQEAAEDARRPPDSHAAVQRLLDRDPDALVLAEQDGRLVGSVIAGWDGWRCHLYRLAVAPQFRRQGIGGVLLAWAEGRFQALGGTRADAMVLQDNQLAHRARRAGGYRSQPEWARWVKPLAGDGQHRRP